jgi:molybdopterin/thiamine biosynthesis adenylyltransferase
MTRKSQSGNNLSPRAWFAAQEPILGPDGQAALRGVSIFVAGAGGLGSSIATFAARAGVERIYQCDPQLVEADNLNRIFAGTRHLGSRKVIAVKELLLSFDRLASDPEFTYTPLLCPVEHGDAQPYLERADFIISCPNSLAARRYLARYAVENAKTLLNVGFSCSPEDFMGGEISLYRPRQVGLACPACVSLNAADQADVAADPLFYPPLAILAGLAVHLLTAEITNFDRQGEARPNFFLYDGFAHELRGLRVPRDPQCTICGSPGTGVTVHEGSLLAAEGKR